MAVMVGVKTPNELMAVFSNTVSAGFSALQGPVNGVFGLMIALVVALTGIQWALSPNREVLASSVVEGIADRIVKPQGKRR